MPPIETTHDTRPPHFPPRRRRLAGPAVARRHSPARAACGRRSRRAAWSASARRWACTRRTSSPTKAGQGLRAHAVPGGRSRTSATTSRSSPGCRTRTSARATIPTYSFLTAAPHPERRAGFRNTHLARPVRGRAHRRPDALPQPAALVRRASACRGPAAARSCPSDAFAVERVRAGCSSRAGPTRSRPRPAACTTARASSTRSATRRRSCNPASAPTTARSSTSTSPASASWSSGWSQAEEWSKKPKPKVDAKPPQNITNPADLIGQARGCWFDLIHLALQTDSTRLITLQLLRHEQRAADPGRDAGPPRPVAPRQGPGQDRAAQDRSKLEKMKTLRDLLGEAEADEGGRRHAARPDDGVLQQQPGQRQQPLRARTCRCCSPAAASSTASTSPSTRRTRRRCATST